MNIFVIGSEDDNYLIVSSVLDCLHQCLDDAFSHSINRESLTGNMTAVILIIDELIDGGVIMSTDAETILERINIKFSDTKPASKSKPEKAEEEKPAESSGGGGYLSFASVFSSAKSQLAKTLAL